MRFASLYVLRAESCDRVKPLFESIAQELLPRESDLSYILNSFPHLFPFAKPAPRLSLSVARPADGELALPAAGAGAAPASAAAPHSVRIVSASALSSALAAVSTRSYLTRGPKRAQASATSTSALAGAPVAGSAPIGNAGDVPAAASTSPSNAFSASGAVGLQPNGATTTQLSTDQLVPQEEHKAHEIIITQSTSSLQSSAPPLAASTPVPNVYADANNSAAARVSAQGSLPLAAAQSASSAGLQPPQPASPTASRLPLVGLVNYTSTGCLQICYANTATQILFHCRKWVITCCAVYFLKIYSVLYSSQYFVQVTCNVLYCTTQMSIVTFWTLRHLNFCSVLNTICTY